MVKLINKLKNKKGFTLIELIVVLAVLAVIMAIAVPRFLGVQENAKVDSDKASLDLIAKTAELYYVQGRIPSKYVASTAVTIDNGETSKTEDDLLDTLEKDFPNLKFQSKTSNNTLANVKLKIDQTTGKATVEFGDLTNN